MTCTCNKYKKEEKNSQKRERKRKETEKTQKSHGRDVNPGARTPEKLIVQSEIMDSESMT